LEDLKLHDAVVFLVAAGLVIPLFKQIRVNPVLGFLLVGLAVGPYGLVRLGDEHSWLNVIMITDVSGVSALAELGVVFLLFMIGLELSMDRLMAMRRLVFGLGSAQVLVTAAVIGTIAWLWGNGVETSLVLGGCLALSSTAIVTQLLIEQGRFGSPTGHGIFAILLAQDIAVVPILFLVGILGAQTGGPVTTALLLAIGEAILAVALILLVGRLIVRPVLRFVANADSPEFFLAVSLLLIIATSYATHEAGLSAALGAFLAGLLVAESEFHHEMKSNIEPFKGLLLGLFFMSVAMWIDPLEMLKNPFWTAASVVGLFVIKVAITAVLGRLFGFSWARSLETGMTLGQGGEFAFVVVGLAVSMAVMPESTAQFMLIVVSATMFLTPAMARLARSVGGHLAAAVEVGAGIPSEQSAAGGGHVIIIGYGRTGQMLGELIGRQMVPFVALDLDVERVRRCQSEGLPLFYGDASREAMLRSVGMRDALAVVICTDDPDVPGRVLSASRKLAPAVPVIVRAHDDAHSSELLAAGATRVIPEVLEAGLELAQITLELAGIPAAVAHSLVESRRLEAEIQMERSPQRDPAPPG
jgi:CPA2 family monovalent cation:H+ antiporter-2